MIIFFEPKPLRAWSDDHVLVIGKEAVIASAHSILYISRLGAKSLIIPFHSEGLEGSVGAWIINADHYYKDGLKKFNWPRKPLEKRSEYSRRKEANNDPTAK